MLPRVRELHERFAEELVVIGVHSGKFVTERRTERIAMACERLGVRHPVVNDRQFRIWRDYAVQAWPTTALIDPEGYLLRVEAGEFDVERMAASIADAVRDASARGTLTGGGTLAIGSTPGGALPARTHPASQRSRLSFPTRAVASEDRLWISDTGNGRVLECEWRPEEDAATVVTTHDGFTEPRGLALANVPSTRSVTAHGRISGPLFLADRGTHSVWRHDSAGWRVIAGNGSLGSAMIDEGDPHAALRSPWGLATHAGALAIAMAGSHQLWRLDLDGTRLSLLAGMGAEEIADGAPRLALLAQPTGVTSAGESLAFADCETSAVRVMDGEVRTAVGTGLFKFGDRAGVGDDALLQHCEDVAVTGGVLAVADTYNDRLKMVDPATRECVPWPGQAGEAGTFLEPAGVSAVVNGLLVCDTGNHRLMHVAADGGLSEVTIA